jgi:RHS repeat-associated protein
MGNILSLTRGGSAQNYTYIGNRLRKVTGGALRGYTYDLNGNALKDTLNTFTYNSLNLPATVSRVSPALSLSYVYDATGRKLRKISNGTARDYIDGIEYNGNTIDIIHTEEGIARNSGGTYNYEYNLSDHLGNVRYGFKKNPNTWAVDELQRMDYHPFGKTNVVNAGTNKYLYNGKELQDELGQLDYGARFYDPVIGRWNVVDPLAETFNHLSPYNYGVNNPILMIDPNGMAAIYNWETGKYEDGGKEVSWDQVQKEYGINQGNEGAPGDKEKKQGRLISNTSGQGLTQNLDGSFNSYETPNNHVCGGFCNLDHKGGEEMVENTMDVATLFIPIKIKGFNFSKYNFSLFKFGIAGKYGFKSYSLLKALTKGLNVEVHHLIEKRFAGLFGEKAGQMTSIVLGKAEHQALTNAWRKEIGYITDNVVNRTNNVTRVQVENAARKIYANYPEILSRLGL